MKSKLLVFLTSALSMVAVGSNVQGSDSRISTSESKTNVNSIASFRGALDVAQPAVRQTKRSVRGAPVFVREKNLDDKVYTYIVQLNDPSAATYRGGIENLTATSPQYLTKRSPGASRKMDTKAPATQSYVRYLQSVQDNFLNQSRSALGRSLTMGRSYKYALNGFTVDMTQEDAVRMAGLAGVKRITRSLDDPLLTDAGPDWIGAPNIWDGSATNGIGTMGEGMIVGILDSGVNGDHPSYKASDAEGYTHTNPLGEGNYIGECFSQPHIVCNSKMIGRWNMTSAPDSEDINGHGSHTAGTSVGNMLDGVPLLDAEGNPMEVSLGEFTGVAPRANLIVYKVCPSNTCPTDAVIAAVEQSIVDGVDVLNHSIGSAGGSPWGEPKSESFKAARAAGISMANSAGNGRDQGPGDAGSTGGAPWSSSIAASTHDRVFPTKEVSFAGGNNPPGAIGGRSVTVGLTAPIVYAGDFENPNSPAEPEQCLEPFPAGTFNGEIVLCDRGAIARVAKAINVRDGGAGGFILCNLEGGAAFLSDDPHVIPAIHISAGDCAVVKEWLADGTGHEATIAPTGDIIRDPEAGDIMANFSSLGPYPDQEWLVPSITAPGVNIFAAYAAPIDYAFLSGTSMSSPHVAGGMTLLKAVHSDWTDAEVLSALMMTADDNVRTEEDITIFDGPLIDSDAFSHGAGSMRVDVAVNAGLVLDETDENFDAANPAIGGDPRTLNLTALYSTECLGNCSFTRTFRATKDGSWSLASNNVNNVGITMEPASFTLAAGDFQQVTFTADVNGLVANEWQFSEAVLVDSTGNSPEAGLPLVVRTAAAIFPDKLELMADRDAGSMVAGGIRTAEISGLTVEAFGIAIPEQTTVSISGSVGDFTPYTGESTEILFYAVPAGSVSFIAETLASTAPDVDMFVGIDLNEDREISEDEELCQSGNSDSIERCELTADQLAEGGVYWVAVFNFEGSGDDIVDDTELQVSVVSPSTDGSISAQVPSSVAGGEEFGVRVQWDYEMEVGTTYLGAVELMAPDGSLGFIPVEINRVENDVKLVSDSAAANVGDQIGMTVEIAPNESPEDRFYVVSAPIPEGTQLVPGSVGGGMQSFVINNQVIWTVEQPSLTRIGRTYQPTINGPNVDQNDPLYNASCKTGFGGYVDLESFGFDLDPEISGNNVSYTAHTEQSVYFYGNEMANGMGLTDDGFLYFGSLPGLNPGSNTLLPDPALPNAVAAILWNDMEIVYDEAEGSGVTMATGGVNLSVVEFDNMQPAPAGSSNARADFVALVSGRLNDIPNQFELIYAYDNIEGNWGDLTVGVENADGSAGSSYDGALSNGLIICWDYAEQPRTSANLTYTVEVLAEASGGSIEAEAFNIVDMPGSVEVRETASIEVAAADSDSDGVLDNVDNCSSRPNPEQVDGDGDGFGNACDADFNQDLIVNFLDVEVLMSAFGSSDETADLNTDGIVDAGDIEVFKTMWLRPPGPSGLE
ncbi:MAG: S8 family serine peptidase [Gammaproteobacteria bacterium]